MPLTPQQTKNMNIPSTLQTIDEKAKPYIKNSLSPKTKKVYQQVWHDFEDWCRHHHLSSLPSSPETMIRYITVLSERNKPTTIKKKMAAISQAIRQLSSFPMQYLSF